MGEPRRSGRVPLPIGAGGPSWSRNLIWLRGEDSNLNKQIQSLLSYRWTTPQQKSEKSPGNFQFAGASFPLLKVFSEISEPRRIVGPPALATLEKLGIFETLQHAHASSQKRTECQYLFFGCKPFTKGPILLIAA